MKTYWHGTPGKLNGTKGVHVGTYKAAQEALEARIGTPLEGGWDGTREYCKTMLAGKKTLGERGICQSGYRCRGPEEDHLPTGAATYSDGTPIAMEDRPTIIAVQIIGPMTNNSYQPHDDFKANGYMSAALKRGHAKRGYFYTNISEDTGSISAVVPSMAHLEIIEA